MYSKELEELIEAVLADGTITEKERDVIHKRAEREGVSLDEIDVYLDGKIFKKNNKSQSVSDSSVFICSKRKGYKKNLFVFLLCGLVLIITNVIFSESLRVENVLDYKFSKEEILGRLKEKAQIATTKVEIRRVGVYDSDSDRVNTLTPINFEKIKIGKRVCVVPVDISIEYGIDLDKMDEGNIEIDSGNVVKIKLPAPEMINPNFEPKTNPHEIVSISTGLRDEVGEPTIQRIKSQVYEETINDTVLTNQLSIEVINNTESFFSSLLKSMGLRPVFIN